MQPIHELLDRIRWDRVFGDAHFVVGYLDRVEGEIVRVPLSELHRERDDHFALTLYDEEGEAHHIPLHRIRALYRNGELIWHRER